MPFQSIIDHLNEASDRAIARGHAKSTLRERRYFQTTLIGASASLCLHIGFLALFTYMNVPALAYFNIISIACFLFAIFALFRYGSCFIPLVIGTIEINVHQALCVFLIGWAAGFQYYIVSLLVMPFFMPHRHTWLRITCAAISMLTFLVLATLFHDVVPVFSVDPALADLLCFVNLSISLLLILVLSYAFSFAVSRAEAAEDRESKRAEELLYNILPQVIAERLSDSDATIADSFEDVSILFADIENFTRFASDMRPGEVVDVLNGLFSRFDDLLDHYGIEKIKTIGDSYMVASGVPAHCDNHAELISDFALDMLAELDHYNAMHGSSFRIRIGINSGPVVAGVIGKRKFIYDLWGDTVNIASRMESNGLSNEIQITDVTRQLLLNSGKYCFSDRGLLEIKGKGQLRAWLLKASTEHEENHAKPLVASY
jgi:class 3 adenylate cyclase